MGGQAHDRAPLARRGGGRSGRRRRTSCRRETTGSRSRGRRRPSASTRTRTACSRSGSAGATRSRSWRRRASSGRSSTSRSVRSARSEPRSTRTAPPKDVGYILEHSDAVGVLCEDEEQLAKVESGARRDSRGCSTSSTFAGLDELAEQGRAFAAPTRMRCREAAEAVEEDDLFTYIYTSGTTGPPKGCMISNRNYYAMVAVVDDLETFTGPNDTMLLYLPLAHNFGRLMHLSGPYVGYTIAFLPDPLQAAAALATVRADRLPERAARLREDPHRRPRQVRRGDGGEAEADRLGASRSAVASARSAGPASRCRGRSRSSTGSRTSSSTRRSRSGWAGGSVTAISGGAPLGTRGRGVLPRARHPADRGLRADRVHDGCDDEHPQRLPLRHGRPGAPRIRAAARRRRRAPRAQRDRLPGLLQGSRGDGRGADAGRLAAHGRHRRDRRRRLRHDHRPEEGHHRHRRRQERLAAEPRERPQGLEVHLAGPRRRRPEAVRRRPHHARRRGDRQVGRRRGARRWRPGALAGAAGARARPGRRRRRQRRPLALRAGAPLLDPAARLHDGTTTS